MKGVFGLIFLCVVAAVTCDELKDPNTVGFVNPEFLAGNRGTTVCIHLQGPQTVCGPLASPQGDPNPPPPASRSSQGAMMSSSRAMLIPSPPPPPNAYVQGYYGGVPVLQLRRPYPEHHLRASDAPGDVPCPENQPGQRSPAFVPANPPGPFMNNPPPPQRTVETRTFPFAPYGLEPQPMPMMRQAGPPRAAQFMPMPMSRGADCVDGNPQMMKSFEGYRAMSPPASSFAAPARESLPPQPCDEHEKEIKEKSQKIEQLQQEINQLKASALKSLELQTSTDKEDKVVTQVKASAKLEQNEQEENVKTTTENKKKKK